MLTLIYGGASSGKSALAERLACQSTGQPKIYLAAMRPFGADAQARISRHRALRKGKGFWTVERYTGLSGFIPPAGGTVLLECIPNLLANELFDPKGAGADAPGEILRGIDAIDTLSHELVVVSGDLFADGRSYPPETMCYIRLLGQINRALAQKAARVIETVCGLPIVHKGELP